MVASSPMAISFPGIESSNKLVYVYWLPSEFASSPVVDGPAVAASEQEGLLWFEYLGKRKSCRAFNKRVGDIHSKKDTFGYEMKPLLLLSLTSNVHDYNLFG